MADNRAEAAGHNVAPVADGAAALQTVSAGDKPRRDAAGRFLARGGARKPAARATAPRRTAKRQPARTRERVAWTGARETLFLATLGETGCIAKAARAAGVSTANVYRRRLQSEDFRARWAVALREARVRLECMLLDRAINGVEESVFYGGKRIAVVRKYDDRSALSLLKRDADAAAEPAPARAEESIEGRRARLKAKLSEMNKRMGGAG